MTAAAAASAAAADDDDDDGLAKICCSIVHQAEFWRGEAMRPT